MLIGLCYIWCQEDLSIEKISQKDGEGLDTPMYTFMTGLYLSLVEAMIKHGSQKYSLQSYLSRTLLLTCSNIPKIIYEFPNTSSVIGALFPLCRIAYAGLILQETELVFPEDKLVEDDEDALVQLALKVDVIIQSKAPGKFHQRDVSINFYHKSVQEFMAALYFTCGPTENISSILCNLSPSSIIDEHENIIKFISGLDPAIGCEILSQFSNIAKDGSSIKNTKIHCGNKSCQVHLVQRNGKKI